MIGSVINRYLRVFSFAVILAMALHGATAAEFFVSPNGDDSNAGTLDQPFATLQRAQQAARQAARTDAVNIWLRGGTYYLPKTLVFTAEDSGTAQAPVVYQAWKDEPVIISGGQRLWLDWQPYRNGIMKAKVPDDLVTDQLFINGKRQILARYPNFDPNVAILNGYSADAISPERAARWSDPKGGIIHALQDNLWGSLDYVITGKDTNNQISYEGGWQNNRPSHMHKEYRYVENIFEELDAPGEWFHDRKTGTLYYYSPAGFDLKNAIVETVRLRQLIAFDGSQEKPVRFVTLRGLTFHQTARTFMETREPLLRSDWTIYRGGAVFFNGAEDCNVIDCNFEALGGSSVFVNDYNRRIALRDCLIKDGGASGVCFVGSPKAVRSPLFEYKARQSFDAVDKTPGPISPDYPADCLVQNCLITHIGRFEKQAAGVEISMSENITVRHCSIYEVPRAGINIGDGCWGGDVIEFCDVFDTVLETGDHGSFNSWGRDRYWGLTGVPPNELARLALLDTVKPNILRYNRWRCDHGWDIDLDDGSSNYEITGNLCLNGGIKLREGFSRTCENNIMVNNSFHPHVWYNGSQDIFRDNIVFAPYKPIRVNVPWGKECDFNLLHAPGQIDPSPAVALQQKSGSDKHSLEADAMFIRADAGDFRVKDGSLALQLGFQNPPMDQFGVTSPRLKILARTPRVTVTNMNYAANESAADSTHSVWRGAVVKNLNGEDYSAIGVAKDSAGVVLTEVPNDCEAAKEGFRTGDFIQSINSKPVRNLLEFMNVMATVSVRQHIQFGLVRNQAEMIVTARSSKP